MGPGKLLDISDGKIRLLEAPATCNTVEIMQKADQEPWGMEKASVIRKRSNLSCNQIRESEAHGLEE